MYYKNCGIDIRMIQTVTAQISPDEDLASENWRNREEIKNAARLVL